MIITFQSSGAERKEAKAAHELFTSNAVVVHIIITLGLVKLLNSSMNVAIISGIGISLGIMLYTYFRTKKVKKQHGFVYWHWQLSLNRYKILLGAYGFYFLITSIGWLFAGDAPSSMSGVSILESILTLLGIVPLFFSVLICTVLGSGSMFNAGRGEIDDKFIKKYERI
jgi:hypothetical protein